MVSPPPFTQPDKDSVQCLAEQIRLGNAKAEHTLIHTYQRGIFNILFHRTQDRELASDLTQDTFIIVLKKLRAGEVRSSNALKSYLRQTAINLHIAYQRKTIRQATSPDENIETYDVAAPKSLIQQIDTERAKLLIQSMYKGLSSERDQQLLRYYFVYDMDKSIICAELDLTPAHFDRVMYRAKKRLYQHIEKSPSLLSALRALLPFFALVALYASVDSSRLIFLSFYEGEMSRKYHLVIVPNREWGQ